ncbi:hypothetical protein MY11210_001157 [Beauveria gryllotalpidicola]
MSQNDTRQQTSWRGHFYLPFECGLCGRPVRRHSLAYGLVSTPDSKNLEEVTQPFVFPHGASGSGRTQPGSTESFVRIGDWAVGARFIIEPAPPGRCVECTVIHADCFELYAACDGRSLDALRYLWFFGLWRQPWNRSKTSQGLRPLPRAAFLCSKAAVNFVLDKAGMPDLIDRFPWEIICYIFECSRDAYLWKAACAVTAASERSELQGDSYTLIPALEIKNWKRGDSAPELLSPSEEAPQFIRFTSDSQGISLIERIRRPRFLKGGIWPQNREYVIAQEQELLCTDIIFKHGRARLRIPDGHCGFTTWDIPCPPPNPLRSARLDDDLSGWVEKGAPLARMCGQMAPANRFQTAQLAKATGVTFIFHRNYLAHIHAHSLEYPVARLPHDTEVLADIGGPLMEEFFSSLVWIYLPLPLGEKILSISFGTERGVQRMQQPNILVGVFDASMVDFC